MADLNSINLQITASASSATKAIDATTKSLENLGSALSKFATVNVVNGLQNLTDTFEALAEAINGIDPAVIANLQSMREAISGISRALTGASKISSDALANIPTSLNAISSALEKLTPDQVQRLNDLSTALQGLKGVGKINVTSLVGSTTGAIAKQTGGLSSGLGSMFSLFTSGAKGVLKGIGEAAKYVGNSFGSAIAPITNFGKSLFRIAKMRALRYLIRSIASGTVQGIKNLAKANAEAQATMNQLASAGQSLANALGGAVYAALAGLIGIINSVVSALMSAINGVSALFAALGGRVTFTRATNSTKKFGDATKSAAKGAKALKQELMAFDEINSLSPDKSCSGGSSGSNAITNFIAMFETVDVPQELINAIRDADFTGIGKMLADKLNTALGKIEWGKIKQKGKELGQMLGTLLTGFFGDIDPVLLGSSIAGSVNTAIGFVNNFIDSTKWTEIGSKIADSLMIAMRRINAVELGMAIFGKIRAGMKFLTGFLNGVSWENVKKFLIGILEGAAKSITNEDLTNFVDAVGNAAANALKTIRGIVSSDTIQTIALKVKLAIQAAMSKAGTVLGEVANLTVAVGNALLTSVLNAVKDEATIEAIRTAITDFFNTIDFSGIASFALNILEATINIGFDLMAGVVSAIADLFGVPKESVDETLHQIKLTWDVAMDMIFRPEYTTGGKDIEAELEKTGSFFNTQRKLKVSVGGVDLDFSNADDQSLKEMDAYLQRTGMSAKQLFTELGAVSTIGLEDGWYKKFAETFQLAAVSMGILEVDMEAVQNAMALKSGSHDLYGFVELIKESGFTASFATLAKIIKDSGYNVDDFCSAMGLTAEQIEIVKTAIEKLKITDVEITDDTSSTEFSNTASDIEDLQEGIESINDTTIAPVVDEKQLAVGTNGVKSSYKIIAQAGTEAADAAKAVATAVVNVPSEKEVTIKLTGSGIFLERLKQIKTKLAGLESKTIALKIKSGLTEGAKTFLKSLQKIDPDVKAAINDVITASQFAKGGFPKVGSLFWAGESGAELVGSIGGRTAVANQAEISNAIFKTMDAYGANGGAVNEQSLANAIVSGLRSAGIGTVYLDGRMLAQSINRESVRSGRPAINF